LSIVFEVTVSEIAVIDSPRVALEKKQIDVFLSKRLSFFTPKRIRCAIKIEAHPPGLSTKRKPYPVNYHWPTVITKFIKIIGMMSFDDAN